MDYKKIIEEIKALPEKFNEAKKASNITIQNKSHKFTSNNVEGALEEVFQSGVEAKSKIVQAINSKTTNSSINTSSSWDDIAVSIKNIKDSIKIPIPISYTINIGTVTVTCDSISNTFKKFRLNGGNWQTSPVFTNLNPNSVYTIEAILVNGSISKKEITTPKANQAKPKPPTSISKTNNSITVQADAGCKIKFNNKIYESRHTFDNLEFGNGYQFYSVRESTNSLNESISDVVTLYTNNEIVFFGSGADPELSKQIKWHDNTANYGNSQNKLSNDKMVLYVKQTPDIPRQYATETECETIGLTIPEGITTIKFTVSEVTVSSGANDWFEMIVNMKQNLYMDSKRLREPGVYNFDIDNIYKHKGELAETKDITSIKFVAHAGDSYSGMTITKISFFKKH